MPKLFDISEWEELSWYSTGGTRAKRFLQNPEGERFYFKQSYRKEVIDYTYEFWSEIIASELGKQLDFDILQYDIAIDGKMVGCICQSMIGSDQQELNEGGKYLQAYDNTFEPDDKATRSRYTFQLVDRAFEVFGLSAYMEQFIHMLIFDALIGNSDRHQENWAFITTHGRVSKALNRLREDVKMKSFRDVPGWFKKFIGLGKLASEENENLTKEGELIWLFYQNVESFSPIYDSGSSLGRELSMDKVEQMLTDKVQLDAYLRRGTSEVHWEGRKINHFELINNLLNTSYQEIVEKRLQKLREIFDEAAVEEMVMKIDNLVVPELGSYKLPDLRKQLIVKMVTLRSEKLGDLIS